MEEEVELPNRPPVAGGTVVEDPNRPPTLEAVVVVAVLVKGLPVLAEGEEKSPVLGLLNRVEVNGLFEDDVEVEVPNSPVVSVFASSAAPNGFLTGDVEVVSEDIFKLNMPPSLSEMTIKFKNDLQTSV